MYVCILGIGFNVDMMSAHETLEDALSRAHSWSSDITIMEVEDWLSFEKGEFIRPVSLRMNGEWYEFVKVQNGSEKEKIDENSTDN